LSGEEYDLVELGEVAVYIKSERRRKQNGQFSARDSLSLLVSPPPSRPRNPRDYHLKHSRNEVICSRPLSSPPSMRAVPLGAGQDSLEIDEKSVGSLGRDLSRKELGPDGFGDFGFGPLQV